MLTESASFSNFFAANQILPTFANTQTHTQFTPTPKPTPASERCQSGRMGRSRKPLILLPGSQGSNPCLSATDKKRRNAAFFV